VIQRLNAQIKACPEQTFALVGYSQGAGVMHAAMNSPGPSVPKLTTRAKLDPAALPKIKALVMFGDPGFQGKAEPAKYAPPFPAVLMDRLRENCNTGDPICDPKGNGVANHLKYSSSHWQKASTEFIVKAFKGEPLPKAPKHFEDPLWAGVEKGS
jgi:cutinase